ncbi:MAG: YdcF family protein [Kofleriaceae bacterium]|nr:YdcF family protein [Kofleriaceae bacterium]
MKNSKLRSRLKRVAKWAGIAGLVLALFMLVCNVWILRYAGPYIYERPYPGFSDRSDVVAIVPGALVRGDEPSVTLRDRLAGALELYQAGHVVRILVSGDHGREDYDEVGPMLAWLVKRGVPEQSIISDHAGFRTLDTMVRAHQVFGVERAIVCTQSFHLPRAVFWARRAGIDAHGVEVDKQRYNGHYKNKVREAIARTVAVLDSYVWNRQPKY